MTTTIKLSQALSLLLFISLWFGCKKDEKITVLTENYKGFFVINEGGFQKSNGSIGLYKPGTGEYFDAYLKANALPLGDVVQSMTAINKSFYIVVNNSNKIEVVNKEDFKKSFTISLNSPRYLYPVSPTKAYVSHLFSNEVSIIDLNTNVKSGTININHWSEHFAKLQNKILVGTNFTKVMVLNPVNDQMIDSIEVGKGLSKLLNVSDLRVAVLATGDLDWSSGNVLENGKLCFINKDSNKIEKTIPLSTGSYGGSMAFNNNLQTIYLSLGGTKIYQYTEAGGLVEFITLNTGESVYGLAVNPSNGDIYITDAGDFNSNGKVYIYDSNKNRKKVIEAGIVPNGVLFNE
jgi:DNA-binding beta-propeller fold protein YncE